MFGRKEGEWRTGTSCLGGGLVWGRVASRMGRRGGGANLFVDSRAEDGGGLEDHLELEWKPVKVGDHHLLDGGGEGEEGFEQGLLVPDGRGSPHVRRTGFEKPASDAHQGEEKKKEMVVAKEVGGSGCG